MHIDLKFPHESTEKLGRFAEVADNVGHAITFKIFSNESKIIFISRIRSAEKTQVKNKILEPFEDDQILKSKFKDRKKLPKFDPNNLIERTL